MRPVVCRLLQALLIPFGLEDLGDALTDLVDHLLVVVQVFHAHVCSDSMSAFVPEGSERNAIRQTCL
jgi:hypothetical protein